MSSLNGAWRSWSAAWVCAGVAWVVFAGPLAAQAARGGSLRPYAHVFIAYAVAWIGVMAWLLHIARRLRRATEEKR